MPPSLRSLAEIERTQSALLRQGFSGEAAVRKSEDFATIASALRNGGASADTDAIAHHVPGRIEVLGKHTDYCGGRSVLAATEHGFCFVGVPRDDTVVRIVDVVSDRRADFELSPDIVAETGSWTNYPMTVGRRVARNFPGTLRGADLAFTSDLPEAAGMSSSSAFVTATFLALSRRNALPEHREYAANIERKEDLAGYLGTIENGQSFGSLAGDRGVGTFGGSEDHTAILCARSGALVQYSYGPIRFERTIELDPETIFAVASSGVIAEKTGDAMEKYNRVSRLALALVRLWNETTGGRAALHLHAALRSSPDAPHILRQAIVGSSKLEFPASELSDRLEHFLLENEEIVPSLPDSLVQCDLRGPGALIDRSQCEGARLLKNQIPETIYLAESAREGGAIAASAFGAGFGGSVWALIRRDGAEEFLAHWSEAYERKFPHRAERAEFFVTPAGPAVVEIE